MNNQNIEEILKNLANETVPQDVHRIAEETSAKFTKTLLPSRQHILWSNIMKTRTAKLAAAAVVVIIAVLVGLNVTKLPCRVEIGKSVATELHGPEIHRFPDGFEVKLSEGAKIRLCDSTDRRGFEHIAGEVEVVVKKGDKEFVITSAFGTVKALGTAFKMDIFRVDSTNLLAVNVEEGIIEVSNAKGSKIIREKQRLTVEEDKAPYDFGQDENLPPRLVERIQTMLDAMEKGDKPAWLANFNINAFYDLAKGKVEYEQHPDWFSGMSPDDANRFRQALANVNSPEEIKEIMLVDISDNSYKLYVRSVTLDKDGKHATAICVKKQGQAIGFTPQWTFFDDDWWQTDD